MIGILAAASIVIGVILGWWIAMVCTTAVASFSQERIQRKLRFGPDETARTWTVADWLADETPASEHPAPGREDWPQPS
jgi:hypothetical protein